MLLLLFSDQVVAGADVTLPVVRALLETTPGVMVNVTSDMTGGSADRGRQRELDRYVAGSAAITLNNTNRKYDPQNSAGPYAGNLKPMRALQITGTWGGTTYPIFTGYIDAFDQKYNQRRHASVTIRATDAFKVLARGKLPTSAYAAEVKADQPARWWRLGEPAGSTVFFDQVGDVDLTIQGSPQLDAAALALNDTDGSIVTTASNQGGVSAPEASPGVTSLTAEILYSSADGSGGGETLIAEADGTLSRAWILGLEGSFGGMYPQFTLLTSAGILQINNLAVKVDDGATHHIAATWDGATATLYVDGIVVATGARAGTLFAAGTNTYTMVGGASVAPIRNDGPIGTLDEAAVYYTTLSQARLVAHAEAAADAWDGDLPGVRAARILDTVAPSVSRDLDAGTSTLQSANLAQKPLEHLQKVAESEFGAFFIRADGVVRLAARSAQVNQPTMGTFSDVPAVDVPFRFLEPEYGDTFIRNDVTIARSGGVPQNAVDDDSVDEFQTLDYTLDGLYHKSDSFSRDAALFMVSEYAQPQPRITQLTLMPRRAPAVLYPQALGRELTDRVQVSHTPQGVGAAITQASVIEKITHKFTPDSWETTWRLTPTLTGNFLQLDNPLTTIEGANAARLFF